MTQGIIDATLKHLYKINIVTGIMIGPVTTVSTFASVPLRIILTWSLFFCMKQRCCHERKGNISTMIVVLLVFSLAEIAPL